jgi:hypothetical protein
MTFPDGRRFAFSILDDTDDSTLHNVRPVYDRLRAYGFRTTKTAWPFDSPEGSRLFFAAETLQDKPYLEFVRELAEAGFELAFHGASMESSRRERTIRALEFMRQEFGRYPRLACNHGHNRENIYWGSKRFSTRALRQASAALRREPLHHYAGDVEGSEYFWGDVCRQHVRYVRNFTFRRLNVLEASPETPYALPGTRYVNHWFSTTDAPDVHAFNRALTVAEIDRLEEAGGVCIISTHLGKGFARDGQLNPVTDTALRYLAGRPGWFVPVSEILDHMMAAGGGRTLSGREILRLELRFVADKLLADRAGRGRAPSSAAPVAGVQRAGCP